VFLAIDVTSMKTMITNKKCSKTIARTNEATGLVAESPNSAQNHAGLARTGLI
jgi:hypothetical protein